MAGMVSIKFEGEGKITMALKLLSLGGLGVVTSEIGYDTPYAARVHEDLEMNHPHGGQAKYLETAYRRNMGPVKDYMKEQLRKRRPMKDVVLEGATFILRESQKLVPYDTGALHDSGYVKLTGSGLV